jgi:light-regulated signal transduction histidine kinase (bacteriophytochrome)
VTAQWLLVECHHFSNYIVSPNVKKIVIRKKESCPFFGEICCPIQLRICEIFDRLAI